jgi:phage baseplate assembly protein W
MPVNLDYPLRFDGRGRTASAGSEEYVRDLIEQVLFTAPGERVNRPDFGCGVARLVFEPNSSVLAATSQFLVQGALQQWLSGLITVDTVEVESEDSALRVTVKYVVRATQQRRTETFRRGPGSS